MQLTVSITGIQVHRPWIPGALMVIAGEEGFAPTTAPPKLLLKDLVAHRGLVGQWSGSSRVTLLAN